MSFIDKVVRQGSPAQIQQRVRIVVALALVAIVVMVAAESMAIRKFRHVQNEWASYNRQLTATSLAFSNLRGAIGYGGYIHDYKNFVLRRDQAYLDSLQQNLSELKRELSKLAKLLPTHSELESLNTIQATFDEYQQNLNSVLLRAPKQIDAETLDQLLKVNDQPALSAMQHLFDQLLSRSQAEEQARQRDLEQAINYAWLALVIIPVLLLAICSMLLLSRQLMQANHQLKKAQRKAEGALLELQRTQDVLIESEKMASLGGLVAGIAHEINTPVGVILSSSTYFQEQTKQVARLYQQEDLTEEQLDQYFDTAGEATRLISVNAHRAADLIHSFKQVAVDQTGEQLREFELHQYLHEVLVSLKPKLKRSPVQIAINCPDGIEMKTQAGALSQLVTNLVDNALIHAFEPNQPGQINIDVNWANDDRIELTVSDNGKGISPEHQAKVFEPFFTTRRSDGGSGLGLHIVYNLVTNSLQGSMNLTSALGQGSRFHFSLPRTLVLADQ